MNRKHLTKATIAVIPIIAAWILAITIHTNSAFAAANPPQQPTAHFEDPASPQALQHAKGTASGNSLPLYCGTLQAGDPVPSGCILDVPEDFPPSLLPPK